MTLDTHSLNDGGTIPVLGFGTYKIKGKKGAESIANAIKLGYHFLDTAYNYENEGAVGEAIRQSGVKREDLQILSKLPGRYQHHDDAIIAIEESLYRANLDYFDFYLIHWPNPKRGTYVEAWEAMIEAQKKGLIKHLGTSNFLPEHIDRLVEETGVKPTINEIELHPYFDAKPLRDYHEKNDIITLAWSPLGRGAAKVEPSLLDLPIIQDIAKAHNRTPGQIVLRWHLQLGVVPIPKARSIDHQKENLDVFDFELTTEEMERISSISSPAGRLGGQNPAIYEEF